MEAIGRDEGNHEGKESRQNATGCSRECTMLAGLNFLRSFVDQDCFP